MKILSSYIILDEMVFQAFHGVLPQEAKTGHIFTVNLKIKVDFSQAVLTDNLNDTINYAEIYRMVKEEMNTTSRLIEHVGGRIIERLFKEFGNIEVIKLRLNKVNPPMSADIQSTGIILKCSR